MVDVGLVVVVVVLVVVVAGVVVVVVGVGIGGLINPMYTYLIRFIKLNYGTSVCMSDKLMVSNC